MESVCRKSLYIRGGNCPYKLVMGGFNQVAKQRFLIPIPDNSAYLTIAKWLGPSKCKSFLALKTMRKNTIQQKIFWIHSGKSINVDHKKYLCPV